VGFFSTVFGLGGSRDDHGGPATYDLDHCPYCRSELQGFGCVSCNVEFVMEDGQLVERGLSSRGSREERRCTACDRTMQHGGEFVAAWEEGDNADSYVRCPHCGFHNDF
jgi:DNA-directed RNA polymerase subunit RPC12/RpoP